MGIVASKKIVVTPNTKMTYVPSYDDGWFLQTATLQIDDDSFRITQYNGVEVGIKQAIERKECFTVYYREWDNLIESVERHKKSI